MMTTLTGAIRILSILLLIVTLLFVNAELSEALGQQHQEPMKVRVIPVRPIKQDTVWIPEFQHDVIGVLSQPAVYDRWWAEIMQCSRLHMTLPQRKAITVFYVMSDGFTVSIVSEDTTDVFEGYAEVWRNHMYLIHDDILDEEVVKHEMLHFLLYQNGIAIGHPKEYYVNRCHLRPY